MIFVEFAQSLAPDHAALGLRRSILSSPAVRRAMVLDSRLLAGFILFARRKGLRAKSIRKYIVGMRSSTSSLSFEGYLPPLSPAVEDILKGCDREDADRDHLERDLREDAMAALGCSAPTGSLQPRTRRRGSATAFPPDLLAQLFRIFSENSDPYLRLLLPALIAVGYYGCCRASEYLPDPLGLKTLRLRDLRWQFKVPFSPRLHWLTALRSGASPVGLSLYIRRAKNNQLGEPNRKNLSSAGSHPVSVVWSFLRARIAALPAEAFGPGVWDNEPLFVFSSGRPVRLSWLNRMIRNGLLAAGLSATEAAGFTSHSLRSGATTVAGSRGASDEEMRAMGNWKSDCFRGYVRAPAEEAQADSARSRLGLAVEASGPSPRAFV